MIMEQKNRFIAFSPSKNVGKFGIEAGDATYRISCAAHLADIVSFDFLRFPGT
jgi:hypothetical protein